MLLHVYYDKLEAEYYDRKINTTKRCETSVNHTVYLFQYNLLDAIWKEQECKLVYDADITYCIRDCSVPTHNLFINL